MICALVLPAVDYENRGLETSWSRVKTLDDTDLKLSRYGFCVSESKIIVCRTGAIFFALSNTLYTPVDYDRSFCSGICS